MRAFFKHHAGWLQLAVVVVVVVGSVLLSASLGPEPAPVRLTKAEARLTVTVVTPVVSSYRPDLTLTGTVEASTVTNIVPQVSGKVIHVSPSFRPGARISKGELLFAIETSDYELAMQRTLADIEIARSDLIRLEAEATAEKKIWSSGKPQNDIPDLIARVPQIAAANARIRAGVTVNSSVVLVDFYNQKRSAGLSSIDAAAEASGRRFRPILLTTLTTALGLAPLLLETSPQAQFLIPMGVSLGFGIVVSGFMVLFVTPAVAVIVDDLRER